MLHLLIHFGSACACFVAAILVSLIDVHCSRTTYRRFLIMKFSTAMLGFFHFALGGSASLMLLTGVNVGELWDLILPLYYIFNTVFISYIVIMTTKAISTHTEVLDYSLLAAVIILIFDLCAFFLDNYQGEMWSTKHFEEYHATTLFTILSYVAKATLVIVNLYIIYFYPRYILQYYKDRKVLISEGKAINLSGLLRILICSGIFMVLTWLEYFVRTSWDHYLFNAILPFIYVFFVDAVLRINFESIENSTEDLVSVKGLRMPKNIVGNANKTTEKVEPEQKPDYIVESENNMRQKALALAEASDNMFAVVEQPAEEEQAKEEVEEDNVLVDVQSLKLSDRDRFMEMLVEKWAERKSRPYANGNLTVTELADELRIPVRVLSRIIHDKYGMTFNSWLNYLRVNEIKRMLTEDPSLVVAPLFREMGYTDISTATKIFKRFAGMTPTQFKNQARKIQKLKN